MEYQLLPIGSVVKLKENALLIMVIGYLSLAADTDDKIYEYSGVVFPEGLIDKNRIALFDHNQIEAIASYGYMDAEQQRYVNLVAQVKSGAQKIMEGQIENV